MLSEVQHPAQTKGALIGLSQEFVLLCMGQIEVKLYSRGRVSVFNFCQDSGVLRMHVCSYCSAYVHFLLSHWGAQFPVCHSGPAR